MLFGLFARDAFVTWTSRLLLLSKETWPRHAFIEVVGFKEGRLKVAKGSDFEVRVRADATRPTPPPEVCTIYYRTSENDRGRVNMSRDGEPRDGFQYYLFNGKPFKGILDDIHFDVVGYDCRVRDQHLQVVLSPVVVDVQLKCELPAYTGLLPRTENWNAGTQLPMGTHVTAVVTASKDLRKATIENADSGTVVEELFDEGSSSQRQFKYEIPNLEARHTVLIQLQDTDGISSQEPRRISIGAVADQPPRADVLLRGIGSAVTPDARIPASGSILDDYEIARSWYEIQVKDGASRSFPLELSASGEIETALDLRDQRTKEEDPFELKPDEQIILTVKAEDRYDLTNDPHIGESEPFELAVVRPDELLAILDGRELGLRRRFEQTITEVTETRDSLARVRESWEPPSSDEAVPDAGEDTESASAAEEEEATEDGSSEASERDEARARLNVIESRQRWVQWAVQHAERSTQEVAGLAASFEDIREELINNRVDTPERKSRLEEQIIVPLQRIAEQMFPGVSVDTGFPAVGSGNGLRARRSRTSGRAGRSDSSGHGPSAAEDAGIGRLCRVGEYRSRYHRAAGTTVERNQGRAKATCARATKVAGTSHPLPSFNLTAPERRLPKRVANVRSSASMRFRERCAERPHKCGTTNVFQQPPLGRGKRRYRRIGVSRTVDGTGRAERLPRLAPAEIIVVLA